MNKEKIIMNRWLEKELSDKKEIPEWEYHLQEDIISLNLNLATIRYHEYLNFNISKVSFKDIPRNGSFRIRREIFKDAIMIFDDFYNISPYVNEVIAAPGDTIYNIITDKDWNILKVQKIKVTLKEEGS